MKNLSGVKFTDLELHPNLIQAAERVGFTDLTSIQEQALEPALAGRDIAGLSQTGTGKTLAFLLPVLHRIYSEDLDDTTALIVTPTRELCVQIAEEAERFTEEQPLRITAIYGGEGYSRQEDDLRGRPHIIVATPGRLIDYIKQKKIDGSGIEFLILDEADRMFDMGFIRDIRYIIRFAPQDCRKYLFSATLSYYVMRLASEYMVDPVEVRVEADSVAVDKIEQSLYHLGRDEKSNYLCNQVLEMNVERGVVFTNLKSMVPVLVNRLRKYGIPATGISSLLDQKKRIQLLKKFKTGKYHILVATDVASRGLDIDDITHVFNYDLPQDSESYVHRIGRTARAGKSGVSISYCSEADYENLPRIQRYLGNKIPLGEVDSDYLEPPKGDYEPFDDGTVFREERGGRDSRGRGGRDRERSGRGGGRGGRDRDRDRDRGRDRDRDRDRGGRGRDRDRDGAEVASRNGRSDDSSRGSGRGRRRRGEERTVPARVVHDMRTKPEEPLEQESGNGNNGGRRRRRGGRGGRGRGGSSNQENRPRKEYAEDESREEGGRKRRRRRRGKGQEAQSAPEPAKKQGLLSRITGLFKRK